MTREEQQLLIKDLSARQPYGVIVQINGVFHDSRNERLGYVDCFNNQVHIHGYNFGIDIDKIKPYLRPMPSMTDIELNELQGLCIAYDSLNPLQHFIDIARSLYENHIDCNGLIEKGLALSAPEDMYNF